MTSPGLETTTKAIINGVKCRRSHLSLNVVFVIDNLMMSTEHHLDSDQGNQLATHPTLWRIHGWWDQEEEGPMFPLQVEPNLTPWANLRPPGAFPRVPHWGLVPGWKLWSTVFFCCRGLWATLCLVPRHLFTMGVPTRGMKPPTTLKLLHSSSGLSVCFLKHCKNV